MEWKKILKIVDRYILFLIVLNLLNIAFSFVIPGLVRDIIVMIPFVVTFHAGYSVQKRLKRDGAIGGAITLAGGFFINSLIVAILYWTGVLEFVAGLFVSAGHLIFLPPHTNVMLLLLDIVIGSAIGFVLGAMGSIAAEKLK